MRPHAQDHAALQVRHVGCWDGQRGVEAVEAGVRSKRAEDVPRQHDHGVGLVVGCALAPLVVVEANEALDRLFSPCGLGEVGDLGVDCADDHAVYLFGKGYYWK